MRKGKAAMSKKKSNEKGKGKMFVSEEQKNEDQKLLRKFKTELELERYEKIVPVYIYDIVLLSIILCFGFVYVQLLKENVVY